MGGVVDDGGIARRFWIKFRSEEIFAKYTPFFVCLVSGKLEPESIGYCIAQDVHFLQAFHQAYELAEDCAGDDEDKSAIRKLSNRVLWKLRNHDTLVQEWGFEVLKECTAIDATVKYTEFLLATASGKVEGEKALGKIATPFEKTKLAAYTLAAMAPCMRLYACISNDIQDILDPGSSSNYYQKWIEHYSSEVFEASALQTEELLDRLSVSLTGEELDIIEKLYHQALKLEVDFFSAQPILQKTVVPLSRVHDPMIDHITIFCDFDLTCTAFDSSAILAEIAIITAPKVDSDESEAQLARMSSADLRSTWVDLSSQYTEEYEQCMESIMPSESVEIFNYDDLCKALQQLVDFEKMANSRVIQSGVLKGLNLEDIKRAGQGLILQDGCREFFQKIINNEYLKADVHVLSYCWCGDLIRSALSSGDLNVIKVHSNELAHKDFISTGEIIEKMESPMDKLQCFKNILNNNEGNHLTVYIGGSVGDLLCLLEADIGIVIGSSSSLRILGERFGVTFMPLFSGLVKKQKELVEGSSSKWNGLSGILYTVSSWAEIHAFILGS